MRSLIILAVLLSAPAVAQQPDWLVSWPVAYTMNPGMPRHVLASSSNGHLMSARLMSAAFNYGQDIMGTCAAERIDPTTSIVPKPGSRVSQNEIVEADFTLVALLIWPFERLQRRGP